MKTLTERTPAEITINGALLYFLLFFFFFFFWDNGGVTTHTHTHTPAVVSVYSVFESEISVYIDDVVHSKVVQDDAGEAKGNSVFDRDSRGGYLDREPRSTLDSDGYGGGGGRDEDDFFKSYGK